MNAGVNRYMGRVQGAKLYAHEIVLFITLESELDGTTFPKEYAKQKFKKLPESNVRNHKV